MLKVFWSQHSFIQTHGPLDVAVFEYKCDNYYAPESEGGISIKSPELDIEWPVGLDEAVLSPKDLEHPLWKEFITPFKQ